MRIRLLICLLLFSKVSLCQQSKNVNTLLWRISGKGLSKNSYLFGTMHLTDKRIFHLTDSLYKALETSEGFAGELDMNIMGNQSINNVFAEEEEKRSKEAIKVKDAVSPEIWKMYRDRLAEKIYKIPEKITVDDLEDIEARLQSELIKKGEMETFLDAYLFDLARKQGKWVGGLEDFEDQQEHMNNESVEDKIQTALYDDDYYRSGTEWMIKTYINQQLDSIDRMTYRENGVKDLIMIRRNLKMARRIDSLSSIRSTLFAVGAAHLPGDSGLIDLLRSKGFTVTPVVSQKKIYPDKYTYKRVPALWEKLTVEDSMYTVEMPGRANQFQKLQEYGLDAKFFYDIARMKMYMTMHAELPEERKKLGLDSLYAGLKERFRKQGKLISDKKITVNNTDGREFRLSNSDGEYIIQVFLPEMRRVILNMVFASKEGPLAEADTKKFFQSFVNNTGYTPPQASEKVWTEKIVEPYFFSVSMPIKPVEKKDVNSEEGKIIHSYQAYQVGYPNFFGIVVSSAKEGNYFSDPDSTYFFAVKSNIRLNFEDPVMLDSGFTTVSGLPAYQFRMRGKTDGEEIEISILYVMRGNRSYYLYSVYAVEGEGKANAERFLHSFRIKPYQYGGWKKTPATDSSFYTNSPSPIRRKELEENDIHPGAERWILYDSLNSGTIFIDKIKIPEWFWYDSDTAFLRQRASKYYRESDSVTGYTTKSIGTLNSVEFNVNEGGSQMVKKVKIILNGSELYEVFGNMSRQDFNTIYSRFYDDFTIAAPQDKRNTGKANANSLATILSAADSAMIEKIKHWWNDLAFTTGDLPALQKMMLATYADFDTSYYGNNLNGKIFGAIEKLDSNHTSINYIREHYSALSPKNEYLKPFILSHLSEIHTSESYSLIKNLLNKYSFPENEGLYFSRALDDSLSLTASLFPDLMGKASHRGLWDLVCRSTAQLYDSNLLSKSTIKQYATGFITTARRLLKKEKQQIEESAYLYYDLVKILGIVGTPEAGTLLNQFSKYSDRALRFHTLVAQITANLPVDKRTIYTLASSEDYRHELFDALKKQNKLSIFPRDFLSQKQLAKSKIYIYATDEEPPFMVTPAGEKTALYKGKMSKFYLFKVQLSYSDDAYLGVAGPYSLKLQEYASTHDATEIYWEKPFDSKNIDSLFNEYLEYLKENEE